MTETPAGSPVSGEILGVVGNRAAPLDDARAANVQLRDAVQWLARVASSYATTPERRLQLRFDADARRLSTPDLAPQTRLTLQLPDLVFQFYERGVATPHALDVDDKSSTEIEAWLLAELLHRGFDRDLFRKELPYAWAGQMTGDEAKYAPHRLADSLRASTQDLVEAAIVASQAREGETASDGLARDLPFFPDHCRVGLPTSHGESVEVAYEKDDGGRGRFRVSRHPGGSGPDVLVADAPDAASAVREIAAIFRSAQKV